MHSPALVPQIHTHTHNYNTIHSTVTLYTLAALTQPTSSTPHACPISNTCTPYQQHMHTLSAPHAYSTRRMPHQQHTHTSLAPTHTHIHTLVPQIHIHNCLFDQAPKVYCLRRQKTQKVYNKASKCNNMMCKSFSKICLNLFFKPVLIHNTCK